MFTQGLHIGKSVVSASTESVCSSVIISQKVACICDSQQEKIMSYPTLPLLMKPQYVNFICYPYISSCTCMCMKCCHITECQCACSLKSVDHSDQSDLISLFVDLFEIIHVMYTSYVH